MWIDFLLLQFDFSFKLFVFQGIFQQLLLKMLKLLLRLLAEHLCGMGAKIGPTRLGRTAPSIYEPLLLRYISSFVACYTLLGDSDFA